MWTLLKESNVKLKEVPSQAKRGMWCIFPLPFGELPSQMMALSEGAGWGSVPSGHARGKGGVLLSKCPAYTQPALPEPKTERALSKRDLAKSYILLITRAGTNSFLYKKVNETRTHCILTLLQTPISFKPSWYFYRCQELFKYIGAICRKQTQGYFCQISLWKGKEFSWSSSVGAVCPSSLHEGCSHAAHGGWPIWDNQIVILRWVIVAIAQVCRSTVMWKFLEMGGEWEKCCSKSPWTSEPLLKGLWAVSLMCSPLLWGYLGCLHLVILLSLQPFHNQFAYFCNRNL